jgi:hypothetical protein
VSLFDQHLGSGKSVLKGIIKRLVNHLSKQFFRSFRAKHLPHCRIQLRSDEALSPTTETNVRSVWRVLEFMELDARQGITTL